MIEKEIILNDKKYRLVEDKEETNFYIVRTYSAGVFAGEIVSRNGQEVVMSNAIRLWYWKGAASLSQLAMEGVSCPSECKFAIPVERITLLNAIEILDCTEKSKKCILGVQKWTA